MVPRAASDRYARAVSKRAETVARAVAAYLTLSELAETVEDEWQYVTDLTEAYAPALEALAAATEPLPPGASEAVAEAIDEIGLIEDPHKAIDWLSTFPHVVGLAMGGDVDADRDGEPAGPGGGDDADEPGDDNPFRLLLGGRP